MEHMVVYRSTDGRPGYYEADDLDGAVRWVEHLRNAEGVTDSRIFELHEVPIEYKPYYRVEVAPAGAVEPEPAAEVAPAEVAPVEATEAVPAEVGAGPGFTPPTPVTPTAGARFGLFSRG